MDDDWTPPTQDELKQMAARRERSNKVSQIMGQYMLKETGLKLRGIFKYINCTHFPRIQKMYTLNQREIFDPDQRNFENLDPLNF